VIFKCWCEKIDSYRLMLNFRHTPVIRSMVWAFRESNPSCDWTCDLFVGIFGLLIVLDFFSHPSWSRSQIPSSRGYTCGCGRTTSSMCRGWDQDFIWFTLGRGLFNLGAVQSGGVQSGGVQLGVQSWGLPCAALSVTANVCALGILWSGGSIQVTCGTLGIEMWILIGE